MLKLVNVVLSWENKTIRGMSQPQSLDDKKFKFNRHEQGIISLIFMFFIEDNQVTKM